MSKTAYLLSGIMILAIVGAALGQAGLGSTAVGSQTTTAPTTTSAPASQPAELGMYADLLTVCKLSDEQIVKLREKVADMKQAMDETQAKLAELYKARSEAIKANDTEKAKQIMSQIMEAASASSKTYAEKSAAVLTVLTEEQKVTWDAYSLHRIALGRFNRLTFTDEQQKKIDEMCKDAAKEVGKIDRSDLKTYSEIIQKLVKNVQDNVLTDEQRESLPKYIRKTNTGGAAN